jgi:hypothetical protein
LLTVTAAIGTLDIKGIHTQTSLIIQRSSKLLVEKGEA